MKNIHEAYEAIYTLVYPFFDTNQYHEAQKYFKALAILEMETFTEDFHNRAIEYYILSNLL